MVKLIPRKAHNVWYNEAILEVFRGNSFPDGTYVYLDYWDDAEGLAILREDYDVNLRTLISPHYQITDKQWFSIMLGIASRLAVTHSANKEHGDLCPSNGLSSHF